ncbi:MAG: ABC transporter ATP-binding protein [Clostridiales bacterium]
MNYYNWIFKKIKKYKLLYFTSIMLMFLGASINFMLPDTIKKIIDIAIPFEDKQYLLEKIILLLIIFVLSAICTILFEYIFSIIANKVLLDIKVSLTNSIFNYTGLDIKEKQKKIITVFTRDVFILEQILTRRVSMILIDLISIIVILIYLSYSDLRLTFCIVVTYPILIFAQLKFNKSIKKRTRELMEKHDTSNMNIKELITNIYEYIAYNGKKYFLNRYIPIEEDIVNKKIELNLLFSYNAQFPSSLSSLIIVVILGLGAFFVIDNTVSMGELTIFYIYSNRVFVPVSRVVLFFADLEKTKISMERIYSLIKTDGENNE